MYNINEKSYILRPISFIKIIFHIDNKSSFYPIIINQE